MRAALLAVTVCAGTCLSAQEQNSPNALERSFEIQAHQKLMDIVTDETTWLTPFATDGCSGGMSEAWRVVATLFPDFRDVHGSEPPWEACCEVHDMDYFAAGETRTADESFSARLNADIELRECVIREGTARTDDLATIYDVEPELIHRAYQAIGSTMFRAVRLGGTPCSGLPWRWGFGYPRCDAGP